MVMLLLDKIIEGSYEPKVSFPDNYGILLIRYLNILFCLVEVLLGIFLYYVELNSHIKIIDNQRLELEDKNTDIQQKNSELERHNKIRNKILSIIAHDFRGPLNTLKGTLPLLKRKELTDLEKEKLINENQTRLESTSNLLEMLLSWAKSQYEGAGLKLENINISEVIESSINLYIPMATLKNINIEIQTTPNIFFTIDKNMLSLIIRNLLANAIKFSYNDSTVTVSLKENIDEIVIQVIDSGTGMDPHDVERLFGKRHYTKFGTSGEAGSGLGLLLVKESIEANNGTFTVASELGKGSTFNVAFKKTNETPF
jgi:signal transduction histidine kinase